MSMLEEEPLAAGEVALDDVPDTNATTITTVADPVLDTSAIETAAEPEPEPAAKKTGLLAEHIALRTEAKIVAKRLADLENDPAIQRLTPEIRQAIVEGRIVVKAPPSKSEARNEQLEATAKELLLYKDDGQGNRVPDLDAASRVTSFVRKEARDAVAPLEQAALEKTAQANIDTALKFAEDNGYDVETIKQTYVNAMRAPNGAAMVANNDVAKELWFSAVGRATSAGKLPKALAKREAAVDRQPAAIVSESTGRRGPSAGVQLTPAMQAIYKQHGMDPAKSHSATNKIDMSQGVTLE